MHTARYISVQLGIIWDTFTRVGEKCDHSDGGTLENIYYM